MSEEAAKVTDIFTRKEFVPPQPDEPERPCSKTVDLLERLLERARSGELRGIGVAAIANAFPFSSFVMPVGETVQQLAVLNASVDSLKDQILGEIDSYSYIVPLGDESECDPEPIDA
jgi:hypothetical protein